MPTRTPILVQCVQREFAAHLNLVRHQQHITVDLLADNAGISVPTLRHLLNTGAGSLENYPRVARVLCLLDATVPMSGRLNKLVGRLRVSGARRNACGGDCGGASGDSPAWWD